MFIERSGLRSRAGWVKYLIRISAASRRLHSAQVMALAALRDTIALQYANGFREVLGEGLPAIREHQQAGQPLETSIVTAYLHRLARQPDSLIAPEARPGPARKVLSRAAGVLEAGLARSGRGQAALRRVRCLAAAAEQRIEPGTTADLVTAALYAALRKG